MTVISAPPRSTQATLIWLLSVLALAEIGAGIPPVSYGDYRARFDLSDQQITALFAVLVLGVMVAVGLCRSDWCSAHRSVALRLGLVAAVLADLGLAGAGGYLSLVGASGLLGLSVGAACAVIPGATWLLVGSAPRAGALVAVVNALGLAAGPILAGLGNQLLPFPNRIDYLIHATACLICLAVPIRCRLASSRPGTKQDRRARPPTPHYRTVLLRGLLAFAAGGLVSSLTAVLLLDEFDRHSSVLAGALIAGFFAANAVVAAIVMRYWPERAQVTGTTMILLGLMCAAVAINTGVLAWFILCVALVGGGQGLVISSGLATATQLDADGGASSVSGYFLSCYSGAAAAALLVGSVASDLGPGPAFLGLLAMIAALLVVCDFSLLRKEIRP